jgi:hypothetical protein
MAEESVSKEVEQAVVGVEDESGAICGSRVSWRCCLVMRLLIVWIVGGVGL